MIKRISGSTVKILEYSNGIAANLEDTGSSLKKRLENIRELQQKINEELALPHQSSREGLDDVIRKLSQWGLISIDTLYELKECEINQLIDLL